MTVIFSSGFTCQFVAYYRLYHLDENRMSDLVEAIMWLMRYRHFCQRCHVSCRVAMYIDGCHHVIMSICKYQISEYIFYDLSQVELSVPNIRTVTLSIETQCSKYNLFAKQNSMLHTRERSLYDYVNWNFEFHIIRKVALLLCEVKLGVPNIRHHL